MIRRLIRNKSSRATQFASSYDAIQLTTVGKLWLSVLVDPHRFQRGSWSSILGHCTADPDPVTKKFFKKLRMKKNYLLIINCFLFIPRPLLWISKLQGKFSAVNGEHPAFQNIKFLHFFLFLGSFLPSWTRFSRTKSMRIRNPGDKWQLVKKPQDPSPL